MKIKELVWDMDGTLLDTTEVVPAAFVRAVRALGGPAIGAAEVVDAYGRGTPEVILEHFTGRHLEPSETDVYYRELLGVEVAPYPGTAEVFDALRARGRPRVVFTGAGRRAARILLKAAGLEADVVIGGDQVARPKPAPDGILLAAEMLGAGPAELAYVGDSPLDLRAAKAAGSHGAAAAWGHLYDSHEPADSVLPGPLRALGLLAAGPA
ncbi:HAD family hydrolase [Streptomyces sp. NBC_00876]|uniref:HAD family hydrolase n=1 Tax=Streptomyces sp. NBC_00876 TaxID=2975853 RepID=UPI00386F0ADC|nr:HAD family hydrolase [Streptomyces sp. NBC_00876]